MNRIQHPQQLEAGGNQQELILIKPEFGVFR